ncbi:hypothetical protein FHL15_003828 [Xylaria flabelliformis]|uniref:Uncharacterized protein n=1 Tax=Xylaria flabelliformis TaxID=2512241 RepID=A0A553I4K3_9PEZI|nr:hypothetical protein FHL15_003828 [Xylaria flabelliformis]
MADTEPHPNTNTQNLPPWLRDAYIVNSGSKYAFTPYPIDSYGSLPTYLNDVGPFDKEIYSLDLLQRTRTTDLNAPSLQVILNALVDALPLIIQNKVGLHMTGLPTSGDTGAVIGQPDWFSQSDDDFDKTVQDFENGTIPPLNSGNKQFILWVVSIGSPDLSIPSYVTIVLRYGRLGRITDWGIIDAIGKLGGSTGHLDRVRTRITKLLPPNHGIADATEHQIWIPPSEPGGICVSGLSAYSVVAQLLGRIGIMHCSGASFDADAFFAPMRPWFNPDAVRAEALGHAAVKAMGKLEWKARLALFPVRSFDDGVREVVWPGELAPSEIPPFAHALPGLTESYNVSGDGDSLFGEAEDQDAASESGSSSSSSPGTHSETEVTELENYLLLKREDIERVENMVAAAKAAYREAAEFSERLYTEVLEPPNNSVPSAYAVERFFWLTQRTIERTRSAELQTTLLHRCYASASIHNEVMSRLHAEQRIAVLQEQIEGLKTRYTATDENLHAAYALRKGRGRGQLADVDVIAKAAIGEGELPVIAVVDLEDDEDVAEADPSNEKAPTEDSKERKHEFETTSTRDRKPRKKAKKH